MEYFKSPRFASHVEKLMKEHRVPGLAIAIMQDDQIASAGYGNACIDPVKTCTADTLFDIASLSKSLTAAAVALLIDDDDRYPDVQWDTPVSKILPEDFVMADARYTEDVTVEDILSHRSGLPGHDLSYISIRGEQPDDARSVTRNLRNLAVAAPIRSKYMYCNMMYTVATHLVEVKTQQSFSQFLEERIFQPLGMTSTSLQPSSARAKGLGDRMAPGYFWDKENGRHHEFDIPDCPEAQGAGSITTSVNDLILWVKALMNHEGPISERLYDSLVRMRAIADTSTKDLKPYTSPVLYAAGLDVYYYRGHMVVGHDGMISGAASRFFFLPGLKFGVVMLGNSAEVGNFTMTLTRALVDELLQVPDAERIPQMESQEGHDPSEQNKPDQKDSEDTQTDSQDSGKEQTMPLEAYTGTYRNPGYHALTVEVKNDQLFVDATDRSFGFRLTFEHIGGQTKYTVHLSDYWEGGDDPMDAEFILDGGRPIKLGIHLEEDLKEKIWFERADVEKA
ncbi:hypothetical protein ASPZODRAFT_71601 [Penicilliopsis zonata CBS 506.65]|uniref:Beta-lactamase-related domain-containing protein n=1 Tax=Penicilliopsis zonata CBS 506.65 TaxID=1073090 RepID=A0A1L9SBF9_9EURO|nr:hypothetical protein ASPZODRAFT_71601 [Penicilliopsis zonata CBS 506.65]OJJ44457.1 hypothetical protein ASPZODRAFT_71601 [Penicilliopsis zonata CBS 506.65]